MKILLRHLVPLLRPYRKQIVLATLALLVITAAQLVLPEILRLVVDRGLVQKDTGFLAAAGLVILVVGVVRAVVFFWQRFLSAWIAQQVAFDLRNRLYDHIQRLPFSFHDRSQTGQLISRCIEDVSSMNEFMANGLFEVAQIVILIAGITVLLFNTHWQLAVIAMLPMIPLLLITTRFGSRISALFLRIDQAMGTLSARLQENVTGAQVVRAFAREPYEIDRFDDANRRLYETRVEAFAEFARVFPTTHLLVTLGTIAILWIGGLLVFRDELTIGQLVAFNAYLLLMATPAQQLTWVVNQAGEAVAGLQRIFEILETEPHIADPPEARPVPVLTGRVEFRNVSFRYDGVREYALSGIDFTAEPDQVIALIGATGSGKTSLVNLISRFYDVAEGAVLVDGLDVRELALTGLRSQIGIVLQTSLLFSDSIAENIAFGRFEASDEEIVAAAVAAQADDFIRQLPEGYSTIVGERGITLSGGQRQRVAIARALLLDPRILILDDSTSSVDMQTEHQLQLALARLMEGRTTFVIAHRLTTVKRADLILVLDCGRIVQRGRHEALVAQQGLYREIYDLQLRDQEEFIEKSEVIAGSARNDF
ncbi:MAG TPA: ABC transporter ATP-binding protein [Anaerolineales bacterium]|nr:ABC transporter ATP-binding protein [Anaerolineales bacterium]